MNLKLKEVGTHQPTCHADACLLVEVNNINNGQAMSKSDISREVKALAVRKKSIQLSNLII